jgi:hypothetical protein
MKLAYLYLVVLTIYQTVYGAKSKEKSSSREKDLSNAQTRSNSIASMVKDYPVIPLSDKNFTKFVIERPRNYHAAVMFTATAAKYGCDVCVASKATLYEAANLYQIAYDFNSTSESNRVAFFILEVDGARNTFNELGFETVPRFYILPARSIDDPKVSMANYEVPNNVFMNGPKGILLSLEEITSVKVSITIVALVASMLRPTLTTAGSFADKARPNSCATCCSFHHSSVCYQPCKSEYRESVVLVSESHSLDHH